MTMGDGTCPGCRQGHYAIPGGSVTNYPCTTDGCTCWFCGLTKTPVQAAAQDSLSDGHTPPWDGIEREETPCSVGDCTTTAADEGWSTLIHITMLTSPGEEGYAEVTQAFCQAHFEVVVPALQALGFKSHNHHGTNSFDAEDECGGYGKCQTPAEYGPELVVHSGGSGSL